MSDTTYERSQRSYDRYKAGYNDSSRTIFFVKTVSLFYVFGFYEIFFRKS